MCNKKVLVAILGVFIGVSSIGLGSLPSVRAAVQTRFEVNPSGNIVEKSEEDVTNVNSTMAAIDDSNRDEIESLLGFKINFPDKVAAYIKVSNDIAGISIKDVKYKDEDQIEEKIKNTANYKELYEEVSKDYDVRFNALSIYGKENDGKFQMVSLGQDKGDEVEFSDRWTVKEVKNIEGIECSVIESMSGKGNEVVERGEDGAITSIESDSTLKPTSVEKIVKVVFAHNGIVYDVMASDEDIEKNQSTELEFAKSYIQTLKNM